MARGRRSLVWWKLPGVVAAYQFAGAPSYRHMLSNIAPSGRYSLTSAAYPGWSASSGAVFTGSQYLDPLLSPPQSSQDGSLLVRYSGWTRGSYTMLAGTFFAESGTREFNIGRNGNYSIANHGILDSVTLPVSGVVGFGGTAAYVDAVNVGTLSSPGVYDTRRWIIGAAIYYNTGTPYYHATANIQAVLFLDRPLTNAESVLASHQMAYCEFNPAWNAWSRERRYVYKAPPAPVTAEDRRAAAANAGYFGATLAAAAQGGAQARQRLPGSPRGDGHNGSDRRPAAPAGGYDGN